MIDMRNDRIPAGEEYPAYKTPLPKLVNCPRCRSANKISDERCWRCDYRFVKANIQNTTPPVRSYKRAKDQTKSKRHRAIFFALFFSAICCVVAYFLGDVISDMESRETRISNNAKPMLEQMLNEKYPRKNIRVIETDVISKGIGSNEYQGYATVRLDGKSIEIMFDVTYNKGSMILSIEPLQMLKLGIPELIY